MDPKLNVLYERIRANDSKDIVNLVMMVRDIIADIRRPITGLPQDKDTAEVRMAIIRVVEMFLLNPLTLNTKPLRERNELDEGEFN